MGTACTLARCDRDGDTLIDEDPACAPLFPTLPSGVCVVSLDITLYVDSDGDGCTDFQELGPDESLGGRRDPQNSYDYMNPTADGVNRGDDILYVVQQFQIDQGNPSYDSRADRTYLGPNVWNLGPPDGKERGADILSQVLSFQHDCGPY